MPPNKSATGQNLEMRQMIQEESLKVIREYNKGPAFTDRKLTDTPTDANSVVNKKFVTSNGTTFPSNPVTGQYFFSSVLSKPTFYNGTNWVDPTASVVG